MYTWANMFAMAFTTKFSIDLSPEDKLLLDTLKEELIVLQGKATTAAAIRVAIRRAVKAPKRLNTDTVDLS